MGRWFSKEEREKRDKRVIELYQQGVSYSAIVKRFGFCHSGEVSNILIKYGIARNREPSKEELEKRDMKVIEAYRKGAAWTDIRIQFGVDVGSILRKYGIAINRRGE